MRLRNDKDEEEFISLAGGDDDTVRTKPPDGFYRPVFNMMFVTHKDKPLPISRWSKKRTRDWCERKMTIWTMAKQVTIKDLCALICTATKNQ